MLLVEMLKMVPIPPYRLEIYDVLQINVLGTLLDQPIQNYYVIDGEGTVDLGPAYGKVRLAGMTVEAGLALGVAPEAELRRRLDPRAMVDNA